MVKIEDAISFGISAETSDLRRELRQVHALLRSVEEPTERLAAQQRRLNEMYQSGRVPAQQFEDAMAKATAQAAKQQAALERLRAEHKQLANQVKANVAPAKEAADVVSSLATMRGAISSSVAAAASFGAAMAAIRRSVSAHAELEQAAAKFKVFTGSAKEAEKILSELRAMASEGVSFAAGQRAAATMLQFGVATKDLLPSLRAVAEITAGDSMRMENLALAFAQSAAAGRLMGQELLQMVNAGFSPLKVISEQTGRSMADLREDMSKGLIPFEAVKKAFIDATSTGGKFNGLLDEISHTTSGQLKLAKSRVDELAASFGNLIEPATVVTLRTFNNAASDLTSILRDLASVKDLAKSVFELIPKESAVGSTLKTTVGSSPLSQVLSVVDAAKLGYHGLREEIELLVADFARLNERTGGFAGMFLSGSLKADAAEAARVLRDLDAVREKFEQGQKLSPVEDFFVRRLLDRERATIKTNDAEYRADVEAYEKRLAAAKNFAEKQRAFISLVEKSGQGRFASEDVSIYQRWKKETEAADAAARHFADSQKRIAESINAPLQKLRDSISDLRFGQTAGTGASRAENFRAFAGAFGDADREKLQKHLDEARSLADLRNVGPQALGISLADWNAAVTAADELVDAQRELKRLQDAETVREKQAAVATQYREELDALRSKLEYQRDLARLTEREARIRQLMRDEQLSQPQAAQQQELERQLKAAEKLTKLRDGAKELMRDANPAAGFVEEMAQLEVMRRWRLIDGATYAAQRDRLASESVKSQQVTAAPAIQRGSQDAFRALTGQHVDRINTQIKEAQKQTLLAQRHIDISKRVVELLDELNDNKPQRMGN